MQALLGHGYVVGRTGRRFTLFKLIVLVPAIALTTGSWLLILMLVSYVAGVHPSASWFVGAGLVIAALSGVGLAFITGLEGPTHLSASAEAPTVRLNRAPEEGPRPDSRRAQPHCAQLT